MRARIAYITEWFPPEPGGVPLGLAQALRDRGLEVGVVTGAPHYPTGVMAEGHRPFDWVLDSVEEFRVLRVPEYPSHDRSAIRRIATFGSFATSASVLATREIGRAHATLVYSSPATVAIPAMVARARWGTPYVLMIQDLWPDSVFATDFLRTYGVRRLVEPSLAAFVRAGYDMAAHICVTTQGMKTALVDRGVESHKISVVYNWASEDILRPTLPDGSLRGSLGIGGGDFVALYAGNIGEAQGLGAWIRALSLLADAPRSIHLVLLGDGTQRDLLSHQARELGVSNRVHHMDPVRQERIPALVADADVSVVSLADRELFEITLPSKVQAALALASPIVGSCSGEAASVIRAAGAGWVARPEDPSSIAIALHRAASASVTERVAMGAAGYRYYFRTMSRDIGTDGLVGALEMAMTSRERRGSRSGRSTLVQ